MGPGPGVMEPDENFCLRWNDYEKKYAETFRTLREDDHFADVTLACEGAAVKAHRIILCACSGYFSQLLRTIHPTQHPVLLLSDVRPNDLTSLMDFIYFGQVNITQDSLQSFLKIAEKLKIKGLCERTLLQPDPAIHQAVAITLPIKDEKKPVGAGQGTPSSGQGLLQHQNFESLLGRSPGTFIQTDPNGQQVVSMAGPGHQAPLSGLRHQTVTSAAPPAHSGSPKYTGGPGGGPGGRGLTRPAEQQYMIISSPKKAKYSIAGGQHASILRNQLVTKDLVSGNNVEVKSEPLSMIGGAPGHHEEVPSSEASVSVTEFISSDLLPPLPHGMGSQFMFPPEGCSSGDPGAIAPPPAALVTIQPDKDYSQPPGQPVASRTQVVSVSVEGGQPQPIHSPTTPTHIRPGHVSQEDPEPQDLGVGGLSTSGISSHSSPDTPGKKERNSRKQCPYCQKDFHEMSLKRHIKDVHFKNQNTYVICPQCCKQYASQNSLYSHLNRVHGVKKDDIQLQLQGGVMDRGESNHSADTGQAKYEPSLDTSHDSGILRQTQGNHDLLVRGGHDHDQGIIVRHGGSTEQIIVHRAQSDNNHDGIMDLAQHSDHSN